MGIADFFRPKYKHSDVRVRTEAVKALGTDDAATLVQIARTDRDIGVRRLAIEKIDQADVLTDIAAAETERSLRDFAGQRAARLWLAAACSADAEKSSHALGGMIKLGDQSALVDVVARAENPAARKRAFGELRDPRALAELAKRDIASELRTGAVARIDDGDVLRALAIDTTSKEVGLAAVEKIDDPDRLENVAQKAKNKAVRQKARKIVTEIRDAEKAKQKSVIPDDIKRRRAAKAQLVREVEGLAETFDFAKASPVITAAEASWAALGEGADEIDERFTKAVARFWKRKEVHGSQARSADELRAIEREARESKERNAAERQSKPRGPRAPDPDEIDRTAGVPGMGPKPVETEEQRAAREADAKARREEHEKLRAEEDARRAAQAEERAVRQKADAERGAAIAESLGAMIADLETLAAQEHKDTRAIDRALNGAGKSFDQIGKAAPEQRDSLASRYHAVRGKLVMKTGELREAEDWQRWSNVPKAEALIATAKEWFEAPVTPDLGNRLRGLQALWKEIGPMPQRRSKELWDQFKVACDQVYEKVRGERAVAQEKYDDVAKAKEALIAEAEAVAESTDWAATAEKLKALQNAWKTSGHLPRKQGDDLWKRFRAACDKFFERRKPLLEARAAEETENLHRKQALIARATEIAASAPGAGGWGKAIGEIKDLQEDWKEIGYVPRRDADVVYRQFRAACDSLFAKRDEARNSESNAARAEMVAIETEIAAVTRGEGDDVVKRAVAVREKALEQSLFVDRLDDMLRAVIAARPAEELKGTPIDPIALRAKREKLIARVAELMPKASETPSGEGADIAKQLSAAMKRNAFGDLRFGTREPREVIDELRASWAEAGPFLDDTDRAQTTKFEATIDRVLEAIGGGGSKAVAPRAVVEAISAPVPSAIPVVNSDAATAPVASASGIPMATHDAVTAVVFPPPMPSDAPAAPAEIEGGWNLGDADPTSDDAVAPLPKEDPRAAAPIDAARMSGQMPAVVPVAARDAAAPREIADEGTKPAVVPPMPAAAPREIHDDGTKPAAVPPMPAMTPAPVTADAHERPTTPMAPLQPVRVAEHVVEPEIKPVDEAAAAAAAAESKQDETPSSSEMAGDGATEGDGIDAGWD